MLKVQSQTQTKVKKSQYTNQVTLRYKKEKIQKAIVSVDNRQKWVHSFNRYKKKFTNNFLLPKANHKKLL